jgi:hypothetical protein
MQPFHDDMAMFIFQPDKIPFPVHCSHPGAEPVSNTGFRIGTAFGHEFHLVGNDPRGLSGTEPAVAPEVVRFHDGTISVGYLTAGRLTWLPLYE